MKIIDFISKNRFVLLLIFFGLFFSLLHSVHWIVPYLNNGDIFLPINYSRGGDDYFYYTFVRDIIDGNILLSDPVTIEFRNIYSIYNTYNLSILMGAVGGLFFKGISEIYSFNYFIFPFLNFIIIGAFVRLFIKEIYLNILVVTLVVFFTHPLNAHTLNQLLDIIKYFILFFSDFVQSADLLATNNQIVRFPTVLTTNVHLFFTFWVLIKFWFGTTRTSYFILCSLLLGVSPLISIQNFIILYFFIFIIFIFEFRSLNIRKSIFYLALLSSFLSLPGIAIITETFLNFDILTSLVVEHEYFNPIENPDYWYTFNKVAFITRSLKYVLLIAVIYFLNLKNRKIFIAILLSVFIPYLILSLTLGDHYGYRLFARGGDLIVAAVFFISIISLLLKTEMIKNFFMSKFSKIFTYIIIILINIYVLNFELKSSSENSEKFYDSDFTELYSWINLNTKKDDTFVTIDPDLIIHLPIYSKANMYLPHSTLSRSNLYDRITRIVQLSKYYGMGEAQIFDLLTSLEHQNKKYIFLDHIIYHSLPELKARILKDKEVMDFIKKSIAIDDKPYLKYDHDYLLMSQFDKHLIKSQNLINNYIVDEELVFKNESFKLYELKN